MVWQPVIGAEDAMQDEQRGGGGAGDDWACDWRVCVVVRWQTTDTRNARTRTHARTCFSLADGGACWRGRRRLAAGSRVTVCVEEAGRRWRGWAAAREVVGMGMGMGMEVGGNNGVLQLVHD